ncbi:MAG: hydroxyacid dehydrogenase [Lentisphaerae bacterium]|nr:hydroxyacid dehydrogenase [Lentisphaerota bacterium]
MADISVCPDVFNVLNENMEVLSIRGDDRKEIKDSIRDFDACLTSLKIVLDKEILGEAVNLKVIATASTGTDHIDVEYAKKRGIEIISLKNDIKFLGGITSTAELAWGLLLAVVRKIPWSFDAAKEGIWARDLFRGNQLSGKTLGIIGYGRLGRIVAQYGGAFRMNVIACDVKDVSPEAHVKMVSMDDLLKASDVISIHLHLTPENRGLVNEDSFSKMKPGAILINTSRGAIVDEKAFLDALEKGRLSAAGVDVINGEWSEKLREHPLVRYANTHENLVITPHLGGVTFEAQKATIEFTVLKLKESIRKWDDTSPCKSLGKLNGKAQ